jgi:hypothetical protein
VLLDEVHGLVPLDLECLVAVLAAEGLHQHCVLLLVVRFGAVQVGKELQADETLELVGRKFGDLGRFRFGLELREKKGEVGCT